jgi:hypothetical protein
MLIDDADGFYAVRCSKAMEETRRLTQINGKTLPRRVERIVMI